MALQWSEIRVLYGIPEDIALPADSNARPRALDFVPAPAFLIVGTLFLSYAVWHAITRASTWWPLIIIVSGGLLLVVSLILWHLQRSRKSAEPDLPPSITDPGPIAAPTSQYLSFIAAQGSPQPRVLTIALRRPLPQIVLAFGFIPVLLLAFTDSALTGPALLALYTLAVLTTLDTLPHALRLPKRLRTNACIICGYDLSGTAIPQTGTPEAPPARHDNSKHWIRCPECGSLVPLGVKPSPHWLWPNHRPDPDPEV
jgi:hypothetical protein